MKYLIIQKRTKSAFIIKFIGKCDEYLGLGVSASSFIEKKRIKNIDNIQDYIKRINNKESVIQEIHINDIKDDMEEFLFMGLRMIKGIKLEEFKERFNKDIYEVYGEIIEKNIKKGLLIHNSGKSISNFAWDRNIQLCNERFHFYLNGFSNEKFKERLSAIIKLYCIEK